MGAIVNVLEVWVEEVFFLFYLPSLAYRAPPPMRQLEYLTPWLSPSLRPRAGAKGREEFCHSPQGYTVFQVVSYEFLFPLLSMGNLPSPPPYEALDS